MKSKLTITIASILSVLVLVGVGFAAWVIVNPNVSAEQPGTIDVDTVTDNSYEIEATWETEEGVTENGKIVFGSAGTVSGTPWLTATDKKESLKAVLTLTAKSFQADSWAAISAKTLTVSMKTIKEAADDTGFAALVGKKYIVYPTLTGAGSVSKALTSWTDTVEIPLSAFTGTDGTKTYKLTIQFAWGDYFKVDDEDIVNPYQFFNTKYSYNSSNAKLASDVLTEIFNNLNTVSYKVSIVEKAA